MDGLLLIVVVAGAVVLLFSLVMGLKLHAFVALLITSILTALVAGIPVSEVTDTIEDGMGGILGFVAVIVGLGAMFGEVLRVTGAAERIVDTLVDSFGEKRIQWSLALAGLVIAIPVFFDVAIVLLISLAYTLTQRYGRSLLYYALPLLAGISAASTLVPPTPAPVAATGLVGADLGWVILLGVATALPAVIVAGVYYGRFVAARIEIGLPDHADSSGDSSASNGGDSSASNGGDSSTSNGGDRQRSKPGFALVFSILLTPLALIVVGTVADAVLDDGPLAATLGLIGHPFVALTVAVLLAFYVLGLRSGLSRRDLQGVASKALEPVGLILLVTGAGGVFGAVLDEAGIGGTLEDILTGTAIPVVVLAFLAAVLLRITLGSGTAAMVTAAAVVSPALDSGDYSAPMLALVVLALGCGANTFSHVNDSGFWLVNRFLGLTAKQALLAWTTMQSLLGVVGFAVVLALSLFV
jgi:Gnt-I system low-affinity gluconate transporter